MFKTTLAPMFRISQLKGVLSISIIIAIASCDKRPESPEEVLEEYMTLMSEGKCEEAIKLTTDDVKDNTQHQLNTGCESWNMEILLIQCETSGTTSSCCYKEKRSSMEQEIGFELVKVKEHWKVARFYKPLFCHEIVASTSSIDSANNTEPNWDFGLQFINEYRNFVDTNTQVARKIGWLKNSQFVSENFLNDLQQMTDKANEKDPFIGLGYDPVFVAQDYPDEGFELVSVDTKTNKMTVRGIDWKDFKVEIWLIEKDGNWIVNGAGDVNPGIKN